MYSMTTSQVFFLNDLTLTDLDLYAKLGRVSPLVVERLFSSEFSDNLRSFFSSLVDNTILANIVAICFASSAVGSIIVLLFFNYRHYVYKLRTGGCECLPQENLKLWARPGKASNIVGNSVSRIVFGFYIAWFFIFVIVFALSWQAVRQWLAGVLRDVIIGLISISFVWQMAGYAIRFLTEENGYIVVNHGVFDTYDFLNTFMGLVTGLTSALSRIIYGLISLFLFFGLPQLSVISWRLLANWDGSYYQFWSMVTIDSFHFNPILRYAVYCCEENAREVF
jgi:hypothetical protein